MRIYKEITSDHGRQVKGLASDNNAEYILTSAQAHDLLTEYKDARGSWPSSRWYNRHFAFERIK